LIFAPAMMVGAKLAPGNLDGRDEGPLSTHSFRLAVLRRRQLRTKERAFMKQAARHFDAFTAL